MRTEVLIPIVILCGSAFISIIVLSIYNSIKRKQKNKEENKVVMMNTNEAINSIETNPTVVPTVDNTVLDPTPLPVVEQTVLDPTPLPSVNNTVVDPTPLPVVDVPIPKIDDTPVTVEPTVVLSNEVEESIAIEQPRPVLEVTAPINEQVVVDRAVPLTNENETSINVEKTTPLANDVGENVNLSFANPVNDMGGTAFSSIPTGNTSINTDIKVENTEYEGNKTEIFNLDEIKEALNQE